MSSSQLLTAKWAQMQRRERVLTMACVVIVTGALLDLAVIEPILRGAGAAKLITESKSKELAGYVKQREAMSAEIEAFRRDPGGVATDSAKQLDKALSRGNVWDGAAAERWFDMAVETFGSEVVQLSVASAGAPDPLLRAFFSHEVSLHVRTSWAKAERFLSAQGRVGALRLEAIELGQEADGLVALKVKAQAVSLEKNWGASKPLSAKGAP